MLHYYYHGALTQLLANFSHNYRNKQNKNITGRHNNMKNIFRCGTMIIIRYTI